MTCLRQHRVGNVHIHNSSNNICNRCVPSLLLLSTSPPLQLRGQNNIHSILPSIVVPSIIRPIMSIALPNGSKRSCKGSNECKFMYTEINKTQQRKLPTYDKMMVTMWGLAKASCDRLHPNYRDHHRAKMYQLGSTSYRR